MERKSVSSCLVLQHVAPEKSFAIGEALVAAGVVIETRAPFVGNSIPPDISGFDGLVVMGGPMSAIRDEGFPTRAAEIALLEDALAAGVPILGVCLGAQLLASAAGGVVTAGAAGQEIGWGDVDLSEAASEDPLLGDLPGRFGVLHWHGDTFELPAGATHLASNSRYPNQAFRTGARAWGFQFHVEVDCDAVRSFLEVFGDEARSAGVDPKVIAAETPTRVEELIPIRNQIVARFAGLVAAGAP
jgi:GMP synthase-like glutamine amidotransferase